MIRETFEQRAARKARYIANAFEVLIARLCIFSALSFFFEPGYLERSAIGQAAPAIRYVWVAMMIGAAIAVLAGLRFGLAHIEVAGLILLSSAVVMQGVATITEIGPRAILSVGLFVAVGWACLQRASLVWRHGVHKVRENGG